jgi:hypothetical protein
MSTRAIAWLAVVLTALALVPGGAHVASLPNKIKLVEENYFVAQTLYRGWAWFGIVLIGALAANIAWALSTRRRSRVFFLAAAAAVCLAITLVIFFGWIYPANQLTNNWTVAPEDWTRLRLQWETAHAANAVITFVALCCAAWAALLQKD